MKPLQSNYLLFCMKHMNKKAMLEKTKEIKRKVHKPSVFILCDMLFCAIRFGSGYMDYDLFEMYNMTNHQRDTLVTRRRNNQLVRQYNNPEDMHVFENKNEFNRVFHAYIHREWMDVTTESRTDILHFIRRHSTLMLKPVDTCCGQGIQKIHAATEAEAETLYQSVIQSDYHYILEEVIQQHPAVDIMCPASVNTARIVTLLEHNKVHVMCAFFRIGNGECVDNFNHGGLLAKINEVNGIVISNAVSKDKTVFEHHPMTHTKIKGFQLPDWEQAVRLCISAAHIMPRIRYIAWDVCFTPDGPCLVEGNEYPGYDIYQIPEHMTDRTGLWPKFQERIQTQ